MTSVVVIGGGPAGASFATRMAQLGHEVTLIERQAFPRPRLGESLTPGVPALLAATGAWPQVAAAGFAAARDVRIIWDGDTTMRLKDGAQGLIVERGRFDGILLAHAACEGVRVLQPADILARHHDGLCWRLDVSHGGRRETITATLLADAGGRSAAGARQWTGARTLAVFGYWEGRTRPAHATVAAGENEWVWSVPLPDGRTNVQCFVDPNAFRRMEGSLEERYRALIARSAVAADVSGGLLAGPVSAIDSTSFVATEPVGENVIRLGDAALALDPISSSGVQTALQTALSGAIVANTLLRRPSLARAARQFYRDRLGAAALHHVSWAGEHYGRAAVGRSGAFWAARARPSVPRPAEAEPVLHETVVIAPEARLVESPCLGAEFVELRQALVHPALEEPVAYLGGEPLAPLLAPSGAQSLAALVGAWSTRMAPATALAIAQWLRRKGILVPASEMGAAA